MNNRGSLELSIQTIIIVVIAFVVLGLGLGFVREQFAGIGSTTTAVQEQISQQILDDLRTGNKKLSFPATELRLETGSDDVQAIGIKNTADSELVLKVAFQIKAGDQFESIESESDESFTTKGGVPFSTKVIWDNSELSFSPGETRVIPVTITAPDKTGTYLYKVLVMKVEASGETVFDERTFFIKTS
ncbi:MAG: hypothetical protein Q8Q01_00175 [archaeon]|nr:hypothetical protein [archaeon]